VDHPQIFTLWQLYLQVYSVLSAITWLVDDYEQRGYDCLILDAFRVNFNLRQCSAKFGTFLQNTLHCTHCTVHELKVKIHQIHWMCMKFRIGIYRLGACVIIRNLCGLFRMQCIWIAKLLQKEGEYLKTQRREHTVLYIICHDKFWSINGFINIKLRYWSWLW